MKKLLALAFALTLFALPALADTVDETVYCILAADGALENTLVVTHTASSDGHDFTTVQPEGGQPPFLVTLTYALDGEELTAQEIAGRAGRARVTLRVAPNPACHEAYATRVMAQVQLPLDVTACQNIEAPGAAGALVGVTNTLTYTVMPGAELTAVIAFDTQSFALPGINVGGTAVSVADMLGVDVASIASQATTAADGAQALADGLAQLSGGMQSLTDGIATLSSSATTLSDGITQAVNSLSSLSLLLGTIDAETAFPNPILRAQFTQAVAGLADFSTQGTQLTTGMALLSAGLDTLKTQTETLPASVAQLAAGQQELAAGLADAAGMLGGYPFLTAEPLDAWPSFLDGAKTVDSIQFVYTTPALAPAQEKTPATEETTPDSFLERLRDLFR